MSVAMHGTVRLADLEAYALRLGTLGLFTRPRLVDLRSSSLELTSDDMHHFADIMQHLRGVYGTGRTALVAPADLDYAMGRMYGMLTEVRDPGFAVFRSLHEARAWLIDTPITS